MTRRGRATPIAAAVALVALLATSSVAGAVPATGGGRFHAAAIARPAAVHLAGGGGGHATAPAMGLPIIQYAHNGAAPILWTAHLLNGANPTLSAAGGPRAASDGDGGIQVAYRNPQGHAIWLHGATIARFNATDLTSVSSSATLVSEPVTALSPDGLDEVYFVTRSDHLLQLIRQPQQELSLRTGRFSLHPFSWVRTDLTNSGGPRVTGTPSIVNVGPTSYVFTRTASGDLVEYVTDHLGGRVWSAYDLSVLAAAPKLTSDPTAFYDPVAKEVRVAATELGPTKGDVVVFSPDDVGGRVWSFQDVSKAAGMGPATSGMAGLLYKGAPVLLCAGPSGDLMELNGTDHASGPTTWVATDLSASVTGAPQVAGTPSVALAGTHLEIAADAAGWGDLFEWTNNTTSGAFAATDVSVGGAGPSRTVAGRPAVVFASGVVSMFAAGVSVPAPEGTGVYAIPWQKWPQAIKDGWPILGVTGGLGTRCTPWVGFSQVPTTTPPDEYVGETIQQGHVRETWLSFWTVSGPGTSPSSACAPEQGPIVGRTFYNHGFAAGAFVAAEIDTYRTAGLALKPDWVIFDPEGYPDNHSGLWGPTAPQAKLAQSVADWFAMLAGWRAGIASVDPSLKAALYANQYEYMAYHLYAQSLPTFIAGSFSQKVQGTKKILVPPVRTAYGANIRGFVMYNTFVPTCNQVINERLLLQGPPWSGAYNTVQLPPGSYCAPKAGAAQHVAPVGSPR